MYLMWFIVQASEDNLSEYIDANLRKQSVDNDTFSMFSEKSFIKDDISYVWSDFKDIFN